MISWNYDLDFNHSIFIVLKSKNAVYKTCSSNVSCTRDNHIQLYSMQEEISLVVTEAHQEAVRRGLELLKMGCTIHRLRAMYSELVIEKIKEIQTRRLYTLYCM